jgi:hypothetical protein
MIAAPFALLALAQPGGPLPSPEVVRTSTDWIACQAERMAAVRADVPPEAAADTIMEQCRPLQEAAITAHMRWVETARMTGPQRTAARNVARNRVSAVRAQLIRAIRMRRQR